MRTDQWDTIVIIDGVRIGDTWDTCDSGDIDSDEVKFTPGGMKKQISLGGKRVVGNLTIAKHVDQGAGDWALLLAASAKVGRSVPMTVARQPLDPDGNPFGAPLTYIGTLKTCTPPPHQSDGTPSAAMWTAVCSVTDAA